MISFNGLAVIGGVTYEGDYKITLGSTTTGQINNLTQYALNGNSTISIYAYATYAVVKVGGGTQGGAYPLTNELTYLVADYTFNGIDPSTYSSFNNITRLTDSSGNVHYNFTIPQNIITNYSGQIIAFKIAEITPDESSNGGSSPYYIITDGEIDVILNGTVSHGNNNTSPTNTINFNDIDFNALGIFLMWFLIIFGPCIIILYFRLGIAIGYMATGFDVFILMLLGYAPLWLFSLMMILIFESIYVTIKNNGGLT